MRAGFRYKQQRSGANGAGQRLAAVSASGYFNVAIKTDGSLWQWGFDWFTNYDIPTKIGEDRG